MEASLDADFIAEDIETIVKSAIDQTLSNTVYNPKKLNDWSNQVVAGCLQGLQNLNKPFKYIVTCIIMQKTGAGMNTAVAMRWDRRLDGFCKIPWQNSTMHCIITVFGCAITPSTPPELD